MGKLAAERHVRISFDAPECTAEITGTYTVRLLEAIRDINIKPHLYQAGSCDLNGLVQGAQPKKTTRFYPWSPYGCTQVYSYQVTVNYRESYGLLSSYGMFFNHELPRRGQTFITGKIARTGACIKLGLQDKAIPRQPSC